MTYYSLLALLAATLVAADDFMPYVYFENQEFLANGSNLARMSWSEIDAAFQHPAHADVATFSGLDWTKPYPGSSVDGFEAHLRIANDVPWPDSFAKNQSTEVTALTFGLPSALMDAGKGLPLPMDSSWFICRHYFVSARPDPTEQIDHGCGFLSEECRADMETSLTGNWFQEDPDVPCSALILDPVPVSCQDTLGLVRGDVIALNSESLQDAPTATAYVTDQITDWSWTIGTGAVDEGNTTAYYDASNRTFIIGTVFGYSSSVDEAKRQTPRLSLACLRPEWVPPTTPNVTSAVPPYSYPPQTTTSATTTTAQSSQPATTAPSGPACVSGTVSAYRTSGDFKELCEFSCTYDYCPPTACQCLEYADTAKASPPVVDSDGCPLDGVTDDDFVHLCSFACSHGTCPEATCKLC
ncbi:hypothetical protein RB213_004930 [Colletotrichum asianum]